MLPLKALVQGKLKGHRKIQTPAETSRDKIKDRKSTRLNSSHGYISYAVFCLKKKRLQAIYAVLIYTTGFVAWELPRTVRHPQFVYATSWRREFSGPAPHEFALSALVRYELQQRDWSESRQATPPEPPVGGGSQRPPGRLRPDSRLRRRQRAVPAHTSAHSQGRTPGPRWFFFF